MGLGNIEPDGDGGESDREYVEFTLDDFETFLDDRPEEWKKVDDSHTMEHVFECHGFTTSNGVVLRIYSTVDVRTNKVRSKGSDAIRLVAWNKHLNQPLGGKKKTLRIKTWRKNLGGKIDDMMENPDNYTHQCPECNTIMVVREGKYGEFLGCSRYPKCDETKQLD